MIGVIDAGGGNRAAFGTGIFDSCLDQGIQFDCLVGVSAGSANMVSYLAGQKGRGIKFYADYSFRSEYMGLKAFAATGNYLDLDYIFGKKLAGEGGEYPLDFDTMISRDVQFKIVATDADNGAPVYFDMHDLTKEDPGPCKASCCVPVASKPVEWHGGRYFDGGLSDPLPFRKAMELGAEKVVVILTRPRNYYRNSKNDKRMAKLIPQYPAIQKALIQRAELYNKQLDEAKNLERQGKVLILAPDSIGGMKTLTKNRAAIMTLYDKGVAAAKQIPEFIR